MKKSKALLMPLALSLLLAGCADTTGNSSESASQESSETSASTSESSTSETSTSNSGSSTSETSGSSSSSSESVIEEITVSITDSKGNSSGTAYVGDTVTLTAKVAGVEGKTIAWSSDHTDIATVSETGVVTTIKAGSVTISATVEGVAATYSLTVENVPVAGIAINNKADCSSVSLRKTVQLTATVSPENAFDKTVTWESSDTTVASVDATGLVTPIKQGTAKITAKAGDCSDFIDITVTDPVINADESGLPESYKVSTYREYQVDVDHTGTANDPLDFKTDHSVNVSYSDAQLSIPVMSMPIDNNNYNYLKFVVETSGTYYLFSRYDAKANPNPDPDLYGIYKDDAKDENRVGSYYNFKYDSSDSTAAKFVTGKEDFFLSIQLDAGTYVAKLGKAVAEYEMGIVSVSKKDDSGYEIISATSNPDKKTVTDHYSMEFVKDTAVFSSSMNTGYCAVDGDLHKFNYKEEDNEYLYVDEKEEITVSDMNSFFSWERLLSDKAFKYEETTTVGSGDDSKTIDVFKANLADADDGNSLNIFFSGLGVSEYAQTFMVATDAETGKVSALAITYKDGSTVNVGVEAITDLSITVTHHDVNNDGAAGEDSGITQDW